MSLTYLGPRSFTSPGGAHRAPQDTWPLIAGLAHPGQGSKQHSDVLPATGLYLAGQVGPPLRTECQPDRYARCLKGRETGFSNLLAPLALGICGRLPRGGFHPVPCTVGARQVCREPASGPIMQTSLQSVSREHVCTHDPRSWDARGSSP